MSCASIKINPGVTDISENLKGPNSDDKIRRLERRWKRWELNRNESLQRKCCASVTRITVNSRGNKSVVTDNKGRMLEDEVDEEYKMLLDTYVSHIDVDRDKHVDGFDIDAISSDNNDSNNDSDPQYTIFLENLREEGKISVSSVMVGNQLVHIRYEEEETGSPVESLQSQETERGPCNKRPHSEVSIVPKNNCNSELEPDVVDEDYQIFLNSCRIYGSRKSLSVRQNSQISHQAINTPAVPCDIDQDYQIFLNSEVSSVPKNNCNSELELDGGRKSSSVRQNSQIFYQAINTPAVQCDIDQDYQISLNSEVSSVPKNNCNSELEPDAVHEDYQIFLNSCRIDGNRKSSSVRQNSQISDQAINTPAVQYDIDQDYQILLNSELSSVSKNNCNSELEADAVDEDYQIFLNSCRIDGSRKSSSVRQNSQISDQAINTPAPAVQCDIDQDYQIFLNSEVFSVPKNNCNSELEPDAVDEDYQIFLNSCRIDGGRKSSSVRQNSQISDQAINTPAPAVQCDIDQDYQIFLNSELSSVSKNNCNSELEPDAVDEDYQIFLNSCRIDGSRKSSSVRLNSQISDQAINTRAPAVQCDIDQDYQIFLNSEVSSVPKNNCNSELEPDAVDEDYQIFWNSCRIHGGRKSSSVRQNSQDSDQAINTPAMQCDIDQDYRLLQNAARIIDGNSVYMRDRNITNKYNVEGGSNSSDPDLILLEPHQICENTPFISSKTYDSSWFENETNPRDSTQFPAHDHSEFRRRLMEYLEKPYNQKECDEYMQEVHRQTHKDRHFETRQGVVKSYPAYGVNKSYLELYPDVAKAITEFKEEPHRVLFLLRGFIFWLKNLTHDGIFRPWLDESCLEILRKM